MIRLEGKMLPLSIRRDRTPTVLRKLAKMESDARIARRASWQLPMRSMA